MAMVASIDSGNAPIATPPGQSRQRRDTVHRTIRIERTHPTALVDRFHRTLLDTQLRLEAPPPQNEETETCLLAAKTVAGSS